MVEQRPRNTMMADQYGRYRDDLIMTRTDDELKDFGLNQPGQVHIMHREPHDTEERSWDATNAAVHPGGVIAAC